MNLETNTTTNKISLPVKWDDEADLYINPTLLPTKSQHKFKMVASGTPNDNCGELASILKCKTCGETYPANHHCDRLECPTCYKKAAARIGKRSSAKIRSVHEAYLEYLNPENAKDVYGRELPDTHLDAEFSEQNVKLGRIVRDGGLRHETISIPINEREKWEKFSNTQMLKTFNNHLEKHCPRITGAEFIYHTHRIKPEILKQLKIILSIKKNKADKRKNKQKKALRSNTSDKDENKENPKIYNEELLDKLYDENERSGFWNAIHANVLNLPSKLDYVYFAPHFHVLYWGTMQNASEYYKATGGWVYKNINNGRPIPLKIIIKDGKVLEDNIRAIVAYLASHAAIFTSKSGKAHDSVHYRKLLSPKASKSLKTNEGKKTVQRIYETYIDCEKCGPGNHLMLCDKSETPILGRNGHIYAKDKLVVYKSELTPLGKQMAQRLLNLNWPVSRIQTDEEGIIQVPDPPPVRKKAPKEAENVR